MASHRPRSLAALAVPALAALTGLAGLTVAGIAPATAGTAAGLAAQPLATTADVHQVYAEGPAQITEGDSGDTSVGMTLRLLKPLSKDVRLLPYVTVFTEPKWTGVRENLQQLAAPADSVLIPAGSTTAKISLAIRGDRIPEPDMMVKVTGVSGPGDDWKLIGDAGQVVIRDDDAGVVPARDGVLKSVPGVTTRYGGVDVALGAGDTWKLVVKNKSAKPITNAEVVLTANAYVGDYDVLKPPSTCRAVVDANDTAGPQRSWRCPVGTVKKRADVTLPMLTVATGAQPAELGVVAFLAWPGMDDPNLTNSTVHAHVVIDPAS